MISTRKLSGLPDIEDLRKLCQSLAMLDAIIERNDELRNFFFDSKWDKNQTIGYIKTAEGDMCHTLFSIQGAISIGNAPKSPMGIYAIEEGHPWPGVLDDVPTEFSHATTEPAFSPEEATFCIWRRQTDTSWAIGNIKFPDNEDPDGSEELLCFYDKDPKTYLTWAQEYYERQIHISAVKYIYEYKPLSQAVVSLLNPNITLDDIKGDLSEIGYPF